jgi:ribonuclease HII
MQKPKPAHVQKNAAHTSISSALVCGADEAGRGPLAGPVVCAAVMLDPMRPIAGLKDSKQLSEVKRDALRLEIIEKALCFAIAEVSAEEIDRLNILQASLAGMRRAIAALSQRPELALIDGNKIPSALICPARAIVQGDRTEACISAASILAKTARDARMLEFAELYPGYGFDQHKGYPTQSHLLALQRLGACPIHRRSFAPVRELEKRNQAMQQLLF